jgi:hypothetical protein
VVLWPLHSSSVLAFEAEPATRQTRSVTSLSSNSWATGTLHSGATFSRL